MPEIRMLTFNLNRVIERAADLVLAHEEPDGEAEHDNALALAIAAEMVRRRHAQCFPPLPPALAEPIHVDVAREIERRKDAAEARRKETLGWIAEAEKAEKAPS